MCMCRYLSLRVNVNPWLINPRLIIWGRYHVSSQVLLLGGTITINQPGFINQGLTSSVTDGGRWRTVTPKLFLTGCPTATTSSRHPNCKATYPCCCFFLQMCPQHRWTQREAPEIAPMVCTGRSIDPWKAKILNARPTESPKRGMVESRFCGPVVSLRATNFQSNEQRNTVIHQVQRKLYGCPTATTSSRHPNCKAISMLLFFPTDAASAQMEAKKSIQAKQISLPLWNWPTSEPDVKNAAV